MLPLVIWGSQRVWTKGHPKRLGRTNVPIHIAVGEPITVAPGDSIDEATGKIHAAMETMLHALQEGYPALGPEEQAFLPARLGGTAPTLEEADRMDEEERRDAIRRASAARKAERAAAAAEEPKAP
jgi:hypothetical protein